jgi:hypothetical protein
MQFKQVVPHESGLSSNQFIKLQDKESIKGVFRGDPFDFKQHFIKTENKSYNCTGNGNCEWCAKGEKPKFRFRINFITKDADGNYTAKILEHGARFYTSLKSLHESGYNLEKTVVSITRNGKGTDTTYTILPLPNGVVNESLEKSLSAVKLNDLDNFNKPGQAQREPGEDFDLNEEDLPF